MVKICQNCKKSFPIETKMCPICGSKELFKFCTQCREIIPNNRLTCPTCENENFVNDDEVLENTKSKFHKKILVLLICSAIIIGSIIAYNNILWGNDKIAYDLVLLYAHNFKNPSSVKIVSGTARTGSNGPHAFLCISATNGFGATVAGYYSLSENYIHDLEESSEILNEAGIDIDNSYLIKLCMKQDILNVKKINQALQRVLG